MNPYYIVTAFGHYGDCQWIFERLVDALREIELNPDMFDTHNEVGLAREYLATEVFHARAETYAANREAIERSAA